VRKIKPTIQYFRKVITAITLFSLVLAYFYTPLPALIREALPEQLKQIAMAPEIETASAADVLVFNTIYDSTDEYTPGPKMVFTTDQIGYVFYQNSRTASIAYHKTTNGGASWSGPTNITSGVQYTYRSMHVWYDQWTPGDSGTLIHIIVDGYDNDDMDYWWFDTYDDSYGGPAVIDNTGSNYNSPDMAGAVTKSTDGYLFGVVAETGLADSL